MLRVGNGSICHIYNIAQYRQSAAPFHTLYSCFKDVQRVIVGSEAASVQVLQNIQSDNFVDKIFPAARETFVDKSLNPILRIMSSSLCRKAPVENRQTTGAFLHRLYYARSLFLFFFFDNTPYSFFNFFINFLINFFLALRYLPDRPN